MLRRILTAISFAFCLFALPGANCSPCAVNAVARYDIYVSNVSYGGIPIGDDGNDCSISAPCLTIDKAFTRVLLNTKIWLNGDPLSPALYTTATNLVIGTYSIVSVHDYGAIVAGTGASQVLTLPIDGHVTLGKIIVDGSQNSGGPAPNGIVLATNLNPFSRMDLVLNYTKFSGNTGADVTGTNVRATIAIADAIFSGAGQDGVYLNGLSAGSITNIRPRCNKTNQSTLIFGGCMVVLGANGTTATVTLVDPVMSCTVAPGASGTALQYCIRLHDIVSTVTGGSVDVLGVSGVTRQGAGIFLTHQFNDISGSSISNISVTNTMAGGYGCAVGNEGVVGGVPTVTVTITGCSVTGNSVSAAAALHGVFIGANTQNSVADGGTLTQTGIPLVNKLGAGNTFKNFTIVGWTGTALLAKGATNPAFNDNVATQTLATSGAIGWTAGDAEDGTHSTGGQLNRNTIVNAGGTGFTFGLVEPSNTVTPANNNYTFTSGVNATNVFNINGTPYTTCPSYASAIEPTATCVGF